MSDQPSVTVRLNPDGYLLMPDDWTPDVAVQLAASDGVVLGEEHWRIVGLLREFWREQHVAPPLRLLVRLATARFGPSSGSRYLYGLFPRGPARQGCRYAGLPKPPGCL
jgi:tRNA 2-thiouridine synthesizing protein E